MVDLYRKEGFKIKDSNIIVGYEYTQFIMENKNGKVYYITVKTSTFPTDPVSLPKGACGEIKNLANKFGATPMFAGISFMNADSPNHCNLTCGGEYFVAFKGVELI